MTRTRRIGLSLAVIIGTTLTPILWPAAGTVGAQQDTTSAPGKPKKEKKAKGEKGGKRDQGDKSSEGPQTPAELAASEAARRAKLLRDSTAAVARPLFATRTPLPFTLIANFSAIGKDRDSLSRTRYGGTLVVKDEAGAERRIAVQLRTRGHFRLKKSTCRFVNLLVLFPGKKEETVGTPFDGQKSLKLGAHCQDDDRYEQLLRREYLAYALYNEITPRSFRARLGAATYMDSASGKQVASRAAMFIENEDDVAARQGGRVREFRRALFDDVDGPTLDRMAIFEYMIGNTDWSIYALHNVRLVVTDAAGVLPIPYDFDFSGLVNAPYAGPAPQLQITSVRDRLFRGPCRAWDDLAPTVSDFTSRKAQLMALPRQVPGLSDGDRRDVEDFLSAFFSTASDRGEAKRTFIDGCLRKPGA